MTTMVLGAVLVVGLFAVLIGCVPKRTAVQAAVIVLWAALATAWVRMVLGPGL